ncbi:MAG: AbrB/MazE/SpoVT family DNA-binding domain-containing protein [Bacillota bacterium]
MMKSTGVVRKIDELGRVVLPIELRRTLDINVGDPLEIYVDGESIMLKKYSPGCVFCGSIERLKSFQGKLICGACVAAVSK